MEERIYLAYLHALGISHAKLFELFTHNQDYRKVYEKLSRWDLEKVWYKSSYITKILNKKEKLDTVSIQKVIHERQVKIILFSDDNFPWELQHISNPPFLMYLRWEIDSSAKLSIVGARKLTSYGENVIEKITPELVSYFQIVSGGALWADTISHKVAMAHWGKTISILWTGIDVDYPVGNRSLYNEIAQGKWAVISIFPIGEQWSKYSFPIRNEIVAWLSVWTLIVEAKRKSGTLITANLCLDLWKDLFAIPGNIFHLNSQWCNELIKTGQAKLVSCWADILCEYNIAYGEKIEAQSHKFIDESERKIYDSLLLEALNSNELSIALGMDISQIVSKLSIMEIGGIIKKNISWKYEVL